ncbi:ribokinase [Pseudokineococcus basanitobsidens]|uniref:Ribokinase n=1 Tax=Pseudokineococcus basanitobsidens TaxID=1926649 RepID=A0ABU8RG18_9ACTN
MAQRSGVVVVGSANVDVVLGVDDVPRPGETVLARSRTEHVGGKGLNQAVAAARAGAATTFVGAVGDDAGGRRLRQVLAEEAVDVRCRVVGEPSGTAFVTVAAGGENAIVVDAGANAGLVDLTDDELDAVRGAGHLLCQLEVPLPTVVAAARAASSAGGVVVLNPSPVQALPPDLLVAVDVLVVNEHEAAELAGGSGRSGADGSVVERARPLARRLLEDVPAVVVTLGARGALVAVRGGGPDGVHVPGLEVEAVDTTGAGDVFSGALVAGLEVARTRRAAGEAPGMTPGKTPGEDVSDEDVLRGAARFATAAAAWSVRSHGAASSAPRRGDVEALLGSPG